MATDLYRRSSEFAIAAEAFMNNAGEGDGGGAAVSQIAAA